MRIWRNRSNKAYCCHYKEPIETGEPCILIDTIYFWRGSRSCYLHLKCLNNFIKELRELGRKNITRLLAWKIGG